MAFLIRTTVSLNGSVNATWRSGSQEHLFKTITFENATRVGVYGRNGFREMPVLEEILPREDPTPHPTPTPKASPTPAPTQSPTRSPTRSRTRPTSGSTSPETSSMTSAHEDGSRCSSSSVNGAVAGVVVLGIIFLVLAGGVVSYIRKRQHRDAHSGHGSLRDSLVLTEYTPPPGNGQGIPMPPGQAV